MNTKAKYRAHNAVVGFKLSDPNQVEAFVQTIRDFFKKCSYVERHPNSPLHGKPLNVVVSLTLGEEKIGPMVDLEWAAAALPTNPQTLRGLLHTHKARLDPPVYKRIRRPDGRSQRARLLSLHDLKVLRGAILMKGAGKDALLARGDIL